MFLHARLVLRRVLLRNGLDLVMDRFCLLVRRFFVRHILMSCRSLRADVKRAYEIADWGINMMVPATAAGIL